MDCAQLKNEQAVDDILVIWCATEEKNPVIVGWYQHATVFRNYQYCDICNRDYNIIAQKENCVLLPQNIRKDWAVPVAKKNGFGFGQALVWYGREEQAQTYIQNLVNRILTYTEENWIDKRVLQTVKIKLPYIKR